MFMRNSTLLPGFSEIVVPYRLPSLPNERLAGSAPFVPENSAMNDNVPFVVTL
jgi:hypothetical protein